ncbi:hypothetical protein V6Z12_A01G186200 [Gossypium hirsutum]
MEKEHNILALAMIFCLTIAPVYGQYYSRTITRVAQRAEKMTRLHFFLHDTVSGENPSAVVIARPNITQASPFGFGTLFAINDPLTVGPEPTSMLIGNAQGLYVSSSRDPAVFISVMYADFAFTSGGRGAFRMAQGFALTQINFANLTTGDVILEYNVTLYHY